MTPTIPAVYMKIHEGLVKCPFVKIVILLYFSQIIHSLQIEI